MTVRRVVRGTVREKRVISVVGLSSGDQRWQRVVIA
jgi:hypothetical protein